MMIVALALAVAVPAAPPPVVRTEAGTVRGTRGEDGRAIFRGIPFAAPPVGARRWMPPAPVAPWRGVRDAVRPAPACPQIDYGWNHDAAAHQSEDCLFLDVAAPAGARGLPVIVWIHGGGNRAGAGGGTGEWPLVARGAVVVGIQYRLGALGFLSHPALSAKAPTHASGNQGLMDQQAALRWVRRNIAAFGGDPERVTIAGESAGAQDVGLQLLSPGARGLFARAIEESGTAGFGLPPRSLAGNEAVGRLVVERAGAPRDADAAALRHLPADALVRAAEATDVPGLDDDSYIWLQAVVDGTVLPDTPAALLARGAGSRAPLILGTNARELPLLGGDAQAARTVTRGYGAHAAEARAFYGLPGGAPPPDARLGERPLQIATDLTFRCPARTVARLRDAAGLTSYLYAYDVTGAGGAAVTHGSEIRAVTGAPGTAPLAALWLRFAATGDPAGPGLPHWPRYTRATAQSLVFSDTGPRLADHVRETPCRWSDAP